ncbi:MAG: hypothetical protein HC865_18345 [Cyanobacteria bacterium RU_5_0]|nr:hypothetical protein [Cyanobacteria bacterium RU_5_0]
MGRHQAVQRSMEYGDRRRIRRRGQDTQQNTQQNIRQIRYPSDRTLSRSSPSGRPPRQNAPEMAGLARFVRRHPFAVLIGAWVFLLSLAGTAAISMIKIDASQPSIPGVATSPSTESVVPSQRKEQVEPIENSQRKVTEITQTEKGILPIASLGAIALSCAAGCILISRWLRPQLAQSSDPSLRKPASLASSSRKSSLSLPSSHSPIFSGSSTKSVAGTLSDTVAAKATITIVPTDQSHPLDWQEPSLADNLDLRQRRPLSYWLQK